jgi:hypothetical protein
VIELIAIAILLFSNLVLGFLLFMEKKRNVKTDALRRVIAAFEVEGHTILDIRKINPDNLYLRHPTGH